MSKRLTARWEVSGGGNLDIDVAEVNTLTKEGIEQWLVESAQFEVMEKGNYHISVTINCSDKELNEVIEEEKEIRGEGG